MSKYIDDDNADAGIGMMKMDIYTDKQDKTICWKI
jgi:hypothetical protein